MELGILFPGQGTQIVGMGKDFAEEFSVAKQIFEEADDLLGEKFSEVIWTSSELTRTDRSQLAIFITSFAIFRVLQDELRPTMMAGLSLGEYTALAASGRTTFAETLALVKLRGELMSQACEDKKGGMAVLMGLSNEEVEEMIASIPNLWAANYNCPGQVILSGTTKALEEVKSRGKVAFLNVHGAFHSPLMESARKGLAPHIEKLTLNSSEIPLIMNVPGDFVTTEIKENLIKQVTSPVMWMDGIKASKETQFMEIGPGKTLAGINRRIDPTIKTKSIGKVEDLYAVIKG